MERITDKYGHDIRRRVVLCCAVCVLMMLVLSEGSLAGDIKKVKVPLTELTPLSKVELKGMKSSFVLKVPVPDRWEIRKAFMHFSYVNSAALLSKRSRLSVRLNDHVLAQITLQSSSPVGRVDLNLPAGLLGNSYNDLEFYAVQNYTEQCSDPNAAELWTSIELDRSYIEIDYILKPVPPILSSISKFLFDPKLFDTNVVNIVLDKLSPENLHLASIAASGVSIRFHYRPVRFVLSRDLMGGTDNIVIGRNYFVSDLFDRSGLTPPEGPFGLKHMPGDSGHAVIFISGGSREEILVNTHAFSVISYPLPDTPFASVKDVILPTISKYEGRMVVSPKEKYSFKDLDFLTTTFEGIHPRSADLSFRIPADALIKENEYAVLSMHLVYGASMRSDSVLNLHLNGNFAGAIPLSDEKGGRYQGYELHMPGSLLKPGRNVISFIPTLTPSRTGNCIFIQTDNLAATLYDDSTIEIPSMRHWIKMPSTVPFMEDGFPFTKWPDWRETTVLLTDKSPETAASALNIVSMISQKTGIQPFRIRFSHELPVETDGEVLVIGTFDTIPEKILHGSPVAPALIYPWTGNVPTPVTWQDIIKEHVMDNLSNVEVSVAAAIEGNRLLMSGFESPLKPGRSILLVSAKSQKDLLKGSYTLWQPSVQARFIHNLTLMDLDSPDPRIYSQEAGSKYYVGEIGQVNRLDYYLHTYFWATVAALIFSILLLAWIINRLLKHFRKKRLSYD